MRKFTKLITPMLMLLLMSAVVIVQAQGVAKVCPDPQKAQMIQSLNGEPGDDYNPYFSQTEQKGNEGTDDVKIWVLPTDGSTSINTRAPGNHFLFQRTQYLIRASEIAASGFPVGSLVSSIGFYIATAGVGTQTGTLNIWLQNTTDVTYSLGTTWTTAGFTQVSSNPSFVVPISPSGLIWDETFVGGSPFTYTGGGVYVAWEFTGLGPQGTTGTIHNCNVTLTNGLVGQRSNTSMPTTLAASNWRPATRFGTTNFDDVLEVTHVYGPGKLPIPYGLPTDVGIRVANVTASAATFNLTLEVRDVATNTLEYTSTQSGINLAGNSASVYSFTGWTPAILEDVYVIGIASAASGETWMINNTKTELAQINDNLFSYNYSSVPGSGYGYTTPGEGIFAAKYFMNGSGVVPGVNIFIYNFAANVGATIFACVLNSAGTIVAQSPNYVILSGDLNAYKTFTFASPAIFTNEEFYVGIGQTYLSGATQYYPLGIIAENPLRANTFYNFALTGGTPTASTATWRYMIEAQVGVFNPCDPPTGLNVANISGSSTDLTWTSLSGLSDVEFGPTGFTPTGIPTHSSVTSPLNVPTALATGYDFYVRDKCAGGINSVWVGPKTFYTFCQPCPGGATTEGEAQIPNGVIDFTNGGCAVGNPLLTSPLAPGQTYCGQSNTYLTDVGGFFRDNDYYYVNLTTPANIYWNITATVKGNYDINMIIFDAGALDCGIGAVANGTFTPCQDGVLTLDVPSGHYYVVVRCATSAGNLWPYGSGPWLYELSFNAVQLGAPNLDPDPPAEITELVAPGGTSSLNLPIGNTGTYNLTYSAVTTGAYSNVWQDQFDSYVAGVQLAVQNPADWTTWSLAPGSTEDPYVSSAYAYTGSNSIEITGVVDAVHPLGNLTSGSYRVSHMMYVVPGNVGYFNTLLLFNGSNSQWGMQVAFETDGTATIDAGVFNAATFAYAPGTWMLNEVYVDLDNDYAEYWHNGSFIWSWQWSVGTGGYSLNQLGANNFYAYTGSGGTDNPLFYIDDYKLDVAGNDWLTINGGLGASGSIAVGGASINLNLGFDATGKPVGTYTKTINLTTNELGGAKASYAIPVTMLVGYSISGNVYYGVTGTTKPMVTNTTITCTPGPTVPTGAGGSYTIRPVANGSYALTGSVAKPWGGLQAFDATLIARYLGSIVSFTDLQKRAADVNLSNSITAFDGTLVKRRLGSIATPQWTAPDYVFDGPFPSTPVLIGLPVTVSGANVTQELRTLCSGDLNSSYTPPAE